MKKASIILAMIAIVFCAFAGGFLFGRNFNHSDLSLSVTQPSTSPSTETTSGSENLPEEATATAASMININTATAEQLETLPGIGPVLAQNIITYRETNGPFSDVADLINVSGIGEKRLVSLLEYITVGG